jgi:NADH-quinone oxidoreductase subunit L
MGEASTHGAEYAAHSPEEIRTERLLTLGSVLIALAGIGIGWFIFNRQPLRRMPGLLENKYYVDEAYDAAIITPVHVVSREGLWKIFDVGVIDGFLHTLGRSVVDLGRTFRYMQFGFLRGYAAIILAGALIIIGYFAYQGAQLLTR